MTNLTEEEKLRLKEQMLSTRQQTKALSKILMVNDTTIGKITLEVGTPGFTELGEDPAEICTRKIFVADDLDGVVRWFFKWLEKYGDMKEMVVRLEGKRVIEITHKGKVWNGRKEHAE